ncbi:MAG: NAD(P)/FAD-dependent oxidoreductase [Conexivisphaerales archaeon]
MKIAVVGGGPAGSYLAARLQGRHDVKVFEGQQKDRFTSTCAWATAYTGARDMLRNVGLNFDDYILHKGKKMYVSAYNNIYTIDAPELVTFDKPAMLKDLLKASRVEYGVFVRDEEASSLAYDMIIDATGPYRRVLGPPEGDRDMILPTYQWLVRYDDMPFDDFYIEPFSSFSGYLWYFPLGDHNAFVGAGDVKLQHRNRVEDFLRRYPPKERVRNMGKPIRVAAPRSVTPHQKGKVVGVGEAVGTVYPILGEGILPSMHASELLFSNIDNLNSYEAGLLKKFSAYDLSYEYIRRKITRTDNFLKSFISAVRIFIWFKRNFWITGVNPSLLETFQVLRPRRKAQ